MLNRRTRQNLAMAYNFARPYTETAKQLALAGALTKSSKVQKAAKFIENLVSSGPTSQALVKYQAPGKGFRKTVAAPVSLGSTIRMGGSHIRQISSTTQGGQRIKHRELISSSITSSASFAVSATYPLQPGMATTFPWASGIAQKYEKFRIHAITFHYVPFVASSTAGTIMMMVDYNAQDPVPTTETQFMDHPRSVSCSIWEPLSFRCSVKDIHSSNYDLFVRSSAVAGDIKTFDGGNFSIATDNSTGNPCGKLYVEYDIELLVPQLGPATYLTPVSTSEFLNEVVSQTITKNVITAVNFTTTTYNPLNIVVATNNRFTPPAGCYRVRADVSFQDDTTESNVFTMYLYNNSGAIGSGMYTRAYTSVAGGGQNATIEQVVPLDGSTYVEVRVSMTGTAGILQVLSGSLHFSLA